MAIRGSVLIAGANGAIGSSLARCVLHRGGRPILAGRDEAALRSLCTEMPGAEARVVDFSKADTVTEALKDLPNDLIGCAYAVGSITLKPLRSTKPEEFVRSFELNVISAAETLKAAAPLLKASGGGSVVFFSSVAASYGFTNHAVVSASKGALEGMAVALAAELAPCRTRVNAIAPSLTAGSAMSKPMTKNEKTAAAIAAAHPLGRLGTPEDSAMMAAFLLSDEASWITGQVFGVDGGRSTLR